VLVSPYKHIEKKIKTTLFEKLPKNRYHPKKLSQFCPFDGEINIDAIIKASTYFSEPIRYINYTVWKDPLKQKCLARTADAVLIADVGSLCGENKVIAEHFDNLAVKGVLVPRCNELIKDEEWNAYMLNQVQNTFPNLHAYLINNCSCSFYHPEPSQLATFKQSLYRIVDKENKPTNRIQNGHLGKQSPSFH
jgi:hypothetical protein